MPSLETLAAFFGVSVLLALAPGPDNLFVLMQSAQRGWRAGLCVVFGLCLGIAGHTAAVALGLAAVVAASAAAFTALKFCGAAWLLWLAWGALRAPAGAPRAGAAAQGGDALRMVARGVAMNLTNPKVLIFFLAFVQQFTDPARGPVAWQTVALGLAFMLATLLVFGSIACFSAAFGTLLRSRRAQRLLNRAAALVFLGLAVRLATAQR